MCAEGGLFGAVNDETYAWFGVDGYPAKIVRIGLGLGISLHDLQMAGQSVSP